MMCVPPSVKPKMVIRLIEWITPLLRKQQGVAFSVPMIDPQALWVMIINPNSPNDAIDDQPHG